MEHKPTSTLTAALPMAHVKPVVRTLEKMVAHAVNHRHLVIWHRWYNEKLDKFVNMPGVSDFSGGEVLPCMIGIYHHYDESKDLLTQPMVSLELFHAVFIGIGDLGDYRIKFNGHDLQRLVQELNVIKHELGIE